MASVVTLGSLIRGTLLPSELDEPSLEYLTSLIEEEAEFIREAPCCMTRAQLLHLLTEKLEDMLVTYELVKLDSEARTLCGKIIDAMTEASYIQLATAGDDEEDSAAASNGAYAPPTLSAPVRISDLTRADEERAAELAFSMAAIQKAKASSRWSAAEESVFFQSLADTPQEPEEVEPEEEMIPEGGCQMCMRVMPLTRHHLIPRMHHKHGEWAKMDQSWLLNHVALLCRPCHSAVHKMEDERTLATSFHTLELLMADERMKRWCAYISKRKVNRTVAQTKNGARLHYGK